MRTMNPELTSGQRLMAESQHMGVEVKVAADKLDRLELENAKLREYLQMAARIIDVAVEKSGYNAHPDELEKMHKEMRELGIEVDG